YHADFSAAKQIANSIIEKALNNEMPPFTSLNVNIPVLPIEEIKGIKVVRQTDGYWHEDLEEQTDPYGRKYYWITGHLEDTDTGTDTCQWALNNGYVSVQPVQFDMTAHQHIPSLKFLEQ
ncbi:MAG: 5'/3'-nucleotidase SurE, partial [Bacteroidales bacterium]|nr:5'/3'-nucleotidase SurE [Bacteroidales bacterium]